MLSLENEIFTIASQTSQTFGWRDLLSILAIVIPILFTLFLYLIKRNLDESEKRWTAELGAIRDKLDSVEKQLKSTEEAANAHKGVCEGKYITKNEHDIHMSMLREKITSITENTDNMNDVMGKLFDLVNQLLRRP